MIRCAAIGYSCDQNEPSRPFVLDLPDNPTWPEITTVLTDVFYTEVYNGIDEPRHRLKFELRRKSSHCDLQATPDNDTFLFVSFPPEHRDALRILSSRAEETNDIANCPDCGSGDVRFCNVSVRPYCNECKKWGDVNLGTKEEAIARWNKEAQDKEKTCS